VNWTSSGFARFNYHFLASAEGVVLPIDERFIFLSVYFFLFFLSFLGILVPCFVFLF